MKVIQLTAVALTVLLMVSSAPGQKPDDDEPVGIFQTRAEYNNFIGTAKRIAYGPDGSSELRAMIPMLNDIALNQPIGSTAGRYNTEGSILGMLSDEKVRAELEMVDEQYEDLKQLNSDIQERMAKQIRRLDFSDTSNLVEKIRDLREQAREDLNAVLLPHQTTRLRQIRMQSQLRRRSLVDILTSDPLKTDLEITDKQSDDLRQSEKEIEADLAKQIAKLREKARNRLLSRLNSSQQSEVKEMMGSAFEFSKPAKFDKK